MRKDWNVPTSSTRPLRVWNSIVLEHFSMDSRKRIETVHVVWMRIDRSIFDRLYRCVFDEIENEYFWKRQGLGAEEEHEIPYIDLQLQTHFVK